MSEWVPHYRIDHHESRLECRKAEGGEPYGHMSLTAKAGWWICRNPENGHVWVVKSHEIFTSLYCKVGEAPPKKEKKQEDGHRKGQSRHRSSSHDGASGGFSEDDSLFGCLQEDQDGEEEAEEEDDEVV